MAAHSVDAGHLCREVTRLAQGKVLVIGDVMLDEYLIGDANRISPEAPIPVVRVEDEKVFVGGAGNVARNIKALGGAPHLLGVCGEDGHADTLQLLLRADGIVHEFVSLHDRPTTVKTRVVARQQQMLRIDKEDTSPVCGVDLKAFLCVLAQVISEYDVIVVSDYGKGLVSAELMHGIEICAEQFGKMPRILVDPKTPNYPLYSKVHLLTPNAKETGEAAGMPATTPDQVIAAGTSLLRKLECKHLLTTLGAQGMALFVSPEEVWHIPTVAQKVFDVTGAGDTVMATVALALSANTDPLDACILANYAAGLVVGEVGAAVARPEELQHAISSFPVPDVRRWV